MYPRKSQIKEMETIKIENLTIDNKKKVETKGIIVFSHILYNYTNMQNLREKCMQSWPLNRELDSTYNFHTTNLLSSKYLSRNINSLIKLDEWDM